MLISDIVRRVRDSAGDNAVLQFTNTTLTDWINDAIRECVLENSLLQGKAVAPTVVDQSDYTLPVDIFKVHSIQIDGFKLEMLTLQEFEERNATEPEAALFPQNGMPFLCYIYAGVLTVWPKPQTVQSMTVFYTKLPATITYDSGTGIWAPTAPDINEAFHNRIVSYCLAQVALQDEDHYRYTMLMQEFLTGVRDLKTIKDQEEDLYPSIAVSSRDMGEAWSENHTLF